MKTALALGAEVDVASGAELHAGLAHLGQGLHSKLDWLGRAGKVQPPIHDTLYPTEVRSMSAAGPNTVWFQGPTVGQLWNLLGVVWVAGDDHTTVANATAAVYKASAAQGSPSAAFQLLNPGGTGVPVPGNWYPPRLSTWLHPMDGLMVVFYGAGIANGTQLYATAFVDKYAAHEAERSRLP